MGQAPTASKFSTIAAWWQPSQRRFIVPVLDRAIAQARRTGEPVHVRATADVLSDLCERDDYDAGPDGVHIATDGSWTLILED